MKAMADGPECFSLGSVVSCKTCYDQVIEGEVLAFDQNTKALMLKCASSSGKANVNDIRMVNLNFVSELTVKKEAGSSPLTPPQALNTEKLNTRAKQNIDERQRLAAAIAAGVSHEGIRLFLAIRKTIDDVTWQGKNILVMNQVTIVPPYRPENCKGKSDSDASVLHVRKIGVKDFNEGFPPKGGGCAIWHSWKKVPQQKTAEANVAMRRSMPDGAIAAFHRIVGTGMFRSPSLITDCSQVSYQVGPNQVEKHLRDQQKQGQGTRQTSPTQPSTKA